MNEKKKIGLLVAVEMDSVFSRYGTPGKTEKRGGYDVFQYDNEEYTLYAINSGIGEISAAAATELLIDHYGVVLVVNFGVVGGLTEEMAQARICVVERVVHYDFDISEVDQLLPAQYPDYPDIYLPAAEELVEKAQTICPELKKVTCASADKFVGNREGKERLHRLYHADICEMESAAILMTCRRNGIPCLMIKAVSDGLTGGGEEYYEALQQCAEQCLEVTDRIIREI